ncbi:uncharacterized protein HKW66_Vig0049150 [Vigna angularis]|uniref:Uncharacterized protein n=1 Tax=Phaseolus angularis TaxID=3914 RepID=A0A8T0KZ47_PHAAN|nr:uncharacterized protein HKW66_Vig0049150 [Vigna angularis]
MKPNGYGERNMKKNQTDMEKRMVEDNKEYHVAEHGKHSLCNKSATGSYFMCQFIISRKYQKNVNNGIVEVLGGEEWKPAKLEAQLA